MILSVNVLDNLISAFHTKLICTIWFASSHILIRVICQDTYFHWIVYLWLYLIRILNHTSMERLSLLRPQGLKRQMQCINKFQHLETPPYCKVIPYISMKRSFQVSSMPLHIWFENIVYVTPILFTTILIFPSLKMSNTCNCG